MTQSTPLNAPMSNAELRRHAASALSIRPETLPRHIAVIMDGNGRWAMARGLERIEGHRVGSEAVRRTITECGRLGIEVLTLYSFSLENWKRPAAEVNALMTLACEALLSEREALRSNSVRFRHIGRREGLPASLLRELDATTEATRSCTGLTLALALNYGSRAEIADAARALARQAARGEIDPETIDERAIERHLATAGMSDPDLLIRTAGEHRLSNYLLWQCSYAEIHVTDTLWPDFHVADLHRAIRDYASRTRRFGALHAS